MTILKLATAKDPYIVRESYPTIKGRVATSAAFLEVTIGDRKVTINKGIIEEFASSQPDMVVTGKAKPKKK